MCAPCRICCEIPCTRELIEATKGSDSNSKGIRFFLRPTLSSVNSGSVRSNDENTKSNKDLTATGTDIAGSSGMSTEEESGFIDSSATQGKGAIQVEMENKTGN